MLYSALGSLLGAVSGGGRGSIIPLARRAAVLLVLAVFLACVYARRQTVHFEERRASWRTRALLPPPGSMIAVIETGFRGVCSREGDKVAHYTHYNPVRGRQLQLGAQQQLAIARYQLRHFALEIFGASYTHTHTHTRACA